MPVPGPRTQARDLTDRNPAGELPDRIHGRPHISLVVSGRSPAAMERTLRGCVLAAGQVRHLWRQSVDYIAAAGGYSWTASSPSGPAGRGLGITRALRYMTRSLYVAGGTDNSRLSELHTVVEPKARAKPVTTGGGQARSRPTVRNRLTSFGSRVPPINPRVKADSSGQGQ